MCAQEDNSQIKGANNFKNGQIFLKKELSDWVAKYQISLVFLDCHHAAVCAARVQYAAT